MRRRATFPQPEAAASQRPASRRAPARVKPSHPNIGPPLDEIEVDPSWRRFRIGADEFKTYDRHVELWDGATETAFEIREVSPSHELASHGLAGLVEQIAQVRGSPIVCFGRMSLRFPASGKHSARVLAADQSLYLNPKYAAELIGRSAMMVGEHHYPDLILEVDLTTDVRRNKVKLYEAWGFPELWVEVPDVSRLPASRERRTTIYLHDGNGFVEAPESRTFPGWTAADIHLALNEERQSERTAAALIRVGETLGEREGTGPDDDPLLRLQREQARQEAFRDARRKARREAQPEVRARSVNALQWRASFVRHQLAARGIVVVDDFPLDLPEFASATPEVVAAAAAECVDAADFAARLKRGE